MYAVIDPHLVILACDLPAGLPQGVPRALLLGGEWWPDSAQSGFHSPRVYDDSKIVGLDLSPPELFEGKYPQGVDGWRVAVELLAADLGIDVSRGFLFEATEGEYEDIPEWILTGHGRAFRRFAPWEAEHQEAAHTDLVPELGEISTGHPDAPRFALRAIMVSRAAKRRAAAALVPEVTP